MDVMSEESEAKWLSECAQQSGPARSVPKVTEDSVGGLESAAPSTCDFYRSNHFTMNSKGLYEHHLK